jgi:hypothetical protein
MKILIMQFSPASYDKVRSEYGKYDEVVITILSCGGGGGGKGVRSIRKSYNDVNISCMRRTLLFLGT